MAFSEFFDSEGSEWPVNPKAVALYFDSSLPGPFTPQASPPGAAARYITRRGGTEAAASTGIADFEAHNLVYLGDNLGAWASARVGAGMRARVYCSRSDVRVAFAQVGHLPVLWWIATLDNNDSWNPDRIVNSVRAASGVELDPATIWGIQWGTNPRYDTSYLTGAWLSSGARSRLSYVRLGRAAGPGKVGIPMGHIDRSSGRNKRDKLDRDGPRPRRSNGRIIRGGRLAFARARRTRSTSGVTVRGSW